MGGGRDTGTLPSFLPASKDDYRFRKSPEINSWTDGNEWNFISMALLASALGSFERLVRAGQRRGRFVQDVSVILSRKGQPERERVLQTPINHRRQDNIK